MLAAITFVEVAAIMSQCWIFARTDLYAVLITATGCVNLIRVNQLMMRRALRLITPAQTEELADAPERDRAVARWFRWISMLGPRRGGLVLRHVLRAGHPSAPHVDRGNGSPTKTQAPSTSGKP